MTDGQKLFSPNASTTATFMAGWAWWIFYGDGSEGRGDVWTDAVSFGNLTVPQQAVQVATSVSDIFISDKGSSGLLGLGFNSGNTIIPEPQNTFFDNINPSLEQPVFTADLNRHARESHLPPVRTGQLLTRFLQQLDATTLATSTAPHT